MDHPCCFAGERSAGLWNEVPERKEREKRKKRNETKKEKRKGRMGGLRGEKKIELSISFPMLLVRPTQGQDQDQSAVFSLSPLIIHPAASSMASFY